MHPQERAALTKARRQTGVAIIVIAVASGLIAASLALFLGLVKPEVGTHLLGQSEQHQATVVDVDEVDFCSRSNRHNYTFEWDEEGSRETGQVDLCTRWEVGDTVEIWATGGEPQTMSPWGMRLSMGGGLLFLAILGCFTVRAMARQRRILTAALDGSWRPITCRTLGQPQTPGFRVFDAPQPIRPEKIGRGRAIHTSLAHGAPPGSPDQVPGTLFVHQIRRGKPRRLALWSGADGTRLWRWHG